MASGTIQSKNKITRQQLASGAVLETSNNICCIQLNSCSATNGVASATIPSGYRPTQEVIASCYCVEGSVRTTGFIYAREDGSLLARNGNNTNPTGSLFANIIYALGG